MAEVTIYHNPALKLFPECLGGRRGSWSGGRCRPLHEGRAAPTGRRSNTWCRYSRTPSKTWCARTRSSRSWGFDADDYVDNPDAVVELLSQRKALMQRPVVVRGQPRHRRTSEGSHRRTLGRLRLSRTGLMTDANGGVRGPDVGSGHRRHPHPAVRPAHRTRRPDGQLRRPRAADALPRRHRGRAPAPPARRQGCST